MVHDILSFVIPLGIIYVTLTYVIMMSTCESGSMEPKLMTGNTVFYNRLAYMNSEPQRGDIVVFVSREKNDLLLGKRIIGIPGDRISFNDGCVIVNGKCIDESAYIPNGVKTYCKYEFDVPDNCYFMLGDNRENSYDSRFWNNPYIEKSDLKGKYIGQINFSFEWDIEKKLFPDKGTADNNVSSVYRYSSHNEASSLIP
jgi:signal peptidase I